MEIIDGRPHVRPPTLAEYDMAKKEFEIGVDLAAEGGDLSVEFMVDLNTLTLLYWKTIPKNKKRRVNIGETHDKTKFPT
jgi:hypothetical protein